jgi:hypothetical protein
MPSCVCELEAHPTEGGGFSTSSAEEERGSLRTGLRWSARSFYLYRHAAESHFGDMIPRQRLDYVQQYTRMTRYCPAIGASSSHASWRRRTRLEDPPKHHLFSSRSPGCLPFSLPSSPEVVVMHAFRALCEVPDLASLLSPVLPASLMDTRPSCTKMRADRRSGHQRRGV